MVAWSDGNKELVISKVGGRWGVRQLLAVGQGEMTDGVKLSL
jgi:hypothetical protein